MNRRTIHTLIAALAALALAATPAPAQDDGVFIDPDSPSGKEYQIPLEAARRQADPKRKPGEKVAQGERESPLFGEGVGEEPASTDEQPAAGGSSGGSGGGGGGGEDSAPAPRSAEEEAAVRSATSSPGAPGGGIGTTVLIIGGAALLLGGAAALGVAARGRGRRVGA